MSGVPWWLWFVAFCLPFWWLCLRHGFRTGYRNQQQRNARKEQRR